MEQYLIKRGFNDPLGHGDAFVLDVLVDDDVLVSVEVDQYGDEYELHYYFFDVLGHAEIEEWMKQHHGSEAVHITTTRDVIACISGISEEDVIKVFDAIEPIDQSLIALLNKARAKK